MIQYPDGSPIRVGDRVRLADGLTGIVMVSIDADEYSAGYLREHWSYLGRGTIVDTDRAGLVHYAEPIDIRLVERR